MRVNRLLLTLPLALVLFVGVPVSTAPGGGQAAATATLPDGIALSAPERVGFSSDSLKELDTAIQGLVDAKQLAGVVTLVARHGKVVQHKAYGVQDMAAQTPMRLDTIVRIYSMTKPIAGAAMMMLYEEGKWQPGDPIATVYAKRDQSHRGVVRFLHAFRGEGTLRVRRTIRIVTVHRNSMSHKI